MLKVAICDNERMIRDKLEHQLVEYKKVHKIKMKIDKYGGKADIFKEKKAYDLVFIDYHFMDHEGKNACTMAERLCKRHKDVAIIFLTDCAKVMYDTFFVGTFCFLLKPVGKDKLIKTMDDYLKKVERDNVLTVKTDKKNRMIHTNQITHIEAFGKHSKIHLESGETIEIHESLSSIKNRLPKELFGRCHKSFIVAFAHMKTYTRTAIELHSGEIISIGRERGKEFMEQYLEYLK